MNTNMINKCLSYGWKLKKGKRPFSDRKHSGAFLLVPVTESFYMSMLIVTLPWRIVELFIDITPRVRMVKCLKPFLFLFGLDD